MSDPSPPRGERLFLIGVFCAALLAHFYSATLNWTSGFMPGHEFRQAQTAIVSRYIDEQNNFSLLYETPILGKPWVSILLEVPVYEWSVVGLSRLAGIPHFMAARSVSLACFYLALPALYLLIGRLGVHPTRRLIFLALVLACPVYVFYSRAFLMESMELMCCAWFLLGFVRTMDERRWSWLGVAVVAGTGAALIKSISFAVWLLPAAGYGAWCLGRDLRAGTGWKAPILTIFWGGATVAPALGALRWWINLTDPIKAAHPSAWIFTSRNLSEGNWGLLNLGARFSSQTWGTLLERWQEAIMAPWIIGLGLAVGLFLLPRVRWPVLGLAAVFILAQFIFPFAYAYQDYYFYACTTFLLAALALVVEGMLDSRLPRWCAWLILMAPLAALTHNYWHGYRPVQILKSNGGFPFTEALRDVAPKDSVFIIAGADWAAMIPLYAQHKALMVRNGLEFDEAYLKRAFDDLKDEEVSALVLVAASRGNRPLLDLAAAHFDLDTAPTFSHPIADIYFRRPYINLVQERLKFDRRYADVTVRPRAPRDEPPNRPFDISRGLARYAFPMVSPAPQRGHFTYGLGHEGVDGETVLTAHPDSDLWLRPPAGAGQIRWEFGILESAYARAGEMTDGVEFAIAGESDAGTREIYRRVLDPANQPADRGRQREVIPYRALPGEILRFSSRAFDNSNFDWAYWARIEVR